MYSSCKEIRDLNNSSPSGKYTIRTVSGRLLDEVNGRFFSPNSQTFTFRICAKELIESYVMRAFILSDFLADILLERVTICASKLTCSSIYSHKIYYIPGARFSKVLKSDLGLRLS